mmetsp:Transcript_36655/g.117853  ORF Transcript_36655/g.117853 Transcript_36655/m.117853 type:complete len:188 (+) Transcript_36655:364-927(+)
MGPCGRETLARSWRGGPDSPAQPVVKRRCSYAPLGTRRPAHLERSGGIGSRRWRGSSPALITVALPMGVDLWAAWQKASLVTAMLDALPLGVAAKTSWIGAAPAWSPRRSEFISFPGGEGFRVETDGCPGQGARREKGAALLRLAWGVLLGFGAALQCLVQDQAGIRGGWAELYACQRCAVGMMIGR